jgi:hypothetical protein
LISLGVEVFAEYPLDALYSRWAELEAKRA